MIENVFGLSQTKPDISISSSPLYSHMLVIQAGHINQSSSISRELPETLIPLTAVKHDYDSPRGVLRHNLKWYTESFGFLEK